MEGRGTDIETQWESGKKLWCDTCEEIFGKRKAQNKEWISADTIKKLEMRKEKKKDLNMSQTRAAKTKTQEEYSRANKEVKRNIKKDKTDFIDDVASQAEKAQDKGTSRTCTWWPGS